MFIIESSIHCHREPKFYGHSLHSISRALDSKFGRPIYFCIGLTNLGMLRLINVLAPITGYSVQAFTCIGLRNLWALNGIIFKQHSSYL